MEKIKVFIINLKRSKDRKIFMQSQIKKLFAYNTNLKNQLEFNFFEAVDDSKNEYLQFKSHFPWWSSFILGRELNSNEKSCFASHYSLWIKCQKLNKPIIILEDDVIFSKEFLNNVNIIKILLNANYEYIRLHYSFNKRIKKINDNFFQSTENINGALGYFLHPNAANKFTKKKYWFKPVDIYMDMYYYHKVSNIIYKPFLIHSSSLSSTIGERNDKPKNIMKKIIREFFRFYFYIYKISYSTKRGLFLCFTNILKK